MSAILECEAREPHTPAGRVRRENDCRHSIQRIRSKEGPYNVTLLVSSTHILNLILWMPYFRAKFALLRHRKREVSFIRFSGDLERTSVSVFCKM